MSVKMQEQMRPTHIKLLDFWSAKRVVWLEHGLNLSDESDQLVFLERIEQDSHLVPNGATPVDAAIEYLFVRKKLLVQQISPELRLHHKCTPGRLIHLAKEAHDRRKRQFASPAQMGLAA